MIAKDFQPFNLVKNIKFKKFIKMLNANYSILPKETAYKFIIPQLQEETKQRVKTNLKNVEYITYTIDH